MTMIRALLASLLTVLLFLPSVALGWDLDRDIAPHFREGQNVYVLNGSDFNGFPRNWEQKMEEELDKLHYPFYVIVAQRGISRGDVPSWSDLDIVNDNSYEDSDTEVLARYVEAMEILWARQGAPMSEASIFVLTYEPRKFWYDAGSRFVSELGYQQSAHRPHTNKFISSAQAGNPYRGIVNLAFSADEYLWDQTDPVRIAQRAEQQRLASIRKGRDDVSSQAQRIRESLALDPRYLPDTTYARQLLAESSQAVKSENTQELSAATAILKKEADGLEAHYTEIWYAEIGAAALFLGKVTALLAALFALILFFLGKKSALKSALAAFEGDVSGWDSQIANAENQWSTFLLDRERARGMRAMSGQTAALFNSTTSAIDELKIGIEALKKHVATCRTQAKKASWWNAQPAIDARLALSDVFEFDTKEVNKDDLYGSATKVVSIDADEFANALGVKFATAKRSWEDLLASEQIAKRPLKSLLHREGGSLEILQRQTKVPEIWFNQHPQNSESRGAELEALKSSDPIAFTRELEKDNALAVEVEANVDRIAKLLEEVETASTPALHLDFSTTVFEKDQDPRITWTSAVEKEVAFKALLSGEAPDFAQLLKMGRDTVNLYRRSREMQNDLVQAIHLAGAKVGQAQAAIKKAEAEQKSAASKAREAAEVHKKGGDLVLKADGIRTDVEKAKTLLASAEELLEANKHIAAVAASDSAKGLADQVVRDCVRITSGISELEEQRESYTRMLESMESRRASLRTKLGKYGSHGKKISLRDWGEANSSGIADYALLYAALAEVEDDWEFRVQQAKNSYDTEQAEIAAAAKRQEEEDRRRSRQAEADRRRRDDNNRRNWGGGSSGSGGGWRGGGSSGSGGKW